MRLRRSVPRVVPRVVPCVVLAACLTGCGGPDTGVRVEGRAATAIPWTGPVYVSDQYGRAWQRPETIQLTELVFLDRLTWRDWGASRTVATGEASCGTACSDWRPRSYRVRVVLSGRVRRASVAYYGDVTVTPVRPPAPGWATGFDSTESLNLPDS